jgi:hypothetical protein
LRHFLKPGYSTIIPARLFSVTQRLADLGLALTEGRIYSTHPDDFDYTEETMQTPTMLHVNIYLQESVGQEGIGRMILKIISVLFLITTTGCSRSGTPSYHSIPNDETEDSLEQPAEDLL